MWKDIFYIGSFSDMIPLGIDFVYGFIQTMDGEKDPRNLLLAFNTVAIVAKHFPISK